MKHKPICHYLQEALQREYNQENILQTFLQNRKIQNQDDEFHRVYKDPVVRCGRSSENDDFGS